MWLFILLILVPIIEIALFIQIGGAIGLWPSLAIVVITALIGSTLLRRQGLAALANVQGSVAGGQNPMDHLAHGAFIIVAGIVLLTPGFFTDAIGFLLLVPPVRAALIKAGAARMTGNANFQVLTHGGQQPPQRDDTIDADYEILNESDGQGGHSGWTKTPPKT